MQNNKTYDGFSAGHGPVSHHNLAAVLKKAPKYEQNNLILKFLFSETSQDIIT